MATAAGQGMTRQRAFGRHLAGVLVALMLVLGGLPAAAQQDPAAASLHAVARVDAAQSGIEDNWRGRSTLTLSLSQGVPFRVFHLADPPRVVVDFREVDWSGVQPQDLLPKPGRVQAVRFGPFRAGWSRLILDLAEPMLPGDIALPVAPGSGKATLSIVMRPASAADFAASAGAPAQSGPAFGLRPRARAEGVAHSDPEDRKFVVVLDPGHGGVDPGALRDGVAEKDLMLRLAQALAEGLRRSGLAEVVMTRTEDRFVSLPARVAVAHRAEADLFVSLHADSLAQGGAQGATVYTLAEAASDAAAARLAAQLNRADMLSGVDLTGTDDGVAGVLVDLARQETAPRSAAAAGTLIAAMRAAGGPMNTRPARAAGFSVLTSADVPSVLVELGFISSDRDLANLRDPVWRAVMAEALVEGVLAWRNADLALRGLRRK